MELIFTKDKEWLKKWDDFVVATDMCSHLNLSSWLKSYQSYGFDFEVALLLDNDKILGGYGAVIAKSFFFRFYIIPHGPIFTENHQDNLEKCLKQIQSRASNLKCCYCQFSLPKSSNPLLKDKSYHPNSIDLSQLDFVPGKLFNYVYCSYGINWVDFGESKDSEEFLATLTSKVRRNVRMPYNKGAMPKSVQQITEIREGYRTIEENARRGNYAVRNINDFEPTISELVKNNHAYVINVHQENEVKACILLVKSGNHLTNVTGGVLRSKPDIKLGYMLQWEAIKTSFKLGHKGYDISMGGSDGVKEFKARFGAETITFEDSHYHYIIKPKLFKIFSFMDKNLKPYKNQISKLLSKFKR